MDTSAGVKARPENRFQTYYGIRQKTAPAYHCVGCAMCAMVCPNDAIMPMRTDEADKLKFHINQGGEPERRGGRRNIAGGVLDQIKFIRISMLTDPALDAGRHEFEVRTLLGRVLAPEDNIRFVREHGWIPPVREIYPLIIGGMSFGALSPTMWEGLQMGVAYLNEELGMPVRISTGEGGCPPRLLRSRFLQYVILQIASGYFGWDEIIHAIPEMKVDPCAIEIKYGQGAKPGDGGLLMWHKVNRLIAAIRGVPPGVSLPSPPTHQTQYSIEESVAKMIQSMYMAWGFRVPVYPKISASSTALAVLNNLTRNPYAGGLAIDGEDGGFGPVGDLQLAEDVAHVVAHGALAEEQLRGDLPVGQPLDHQRQDAHFLGGQPGEGRGFLDLGRLAHFFEQGFGHRRVNQRVAAPDGTDGIHQIAAADTLEDIAHCARAHGVHDQLILGIGGEHDHSGIGHLLDDLLTGFDARQPAWHTNVHHDNVGLVSRRLAHGVNAALGLGYHCEIGLLFQKRLQTSGAHTRRGGRAGPRGGSPPSPAGKSLSWYNRPGKSGQSTEGS